MTVQTEPGTRSLFNPLTLGSLQVDNRLVMAPMTRYFSPGYVPSAEAPAYYARRVKGGVGLVITEATVVDEPLSLIHISEPTRRRDSSRMPSSA